MTVAELVVKIGADISDLKRGLLEAMAGIEALKQAGDSTNQGGKTGLVKFLSDSWGWLNRMNAGWLNWIGSLTQGIPIIGSAGSMLGSLAPIFSVLEVGVVGVGAAFVALVVALSAFFAILTLIADLLGTVIALVVDLAGPVAVLVLGFGALAGALMLGVKTALTSGWVGFSKLRGVLGQVSDEFHELGMRLARDFLPYIIQGAEWVLKFLTYADQLARMSLPEAIQSFSTKGIGMLKQLNDWIYKLVSTPIKLIVGIAFGTGGASQRIQSGLGDMLKPWEQLGGQLVGIFQRWFDQLHLTTQGIRIGHELLNGLMRAIGGASGLETYLGKVFEDAVSTGLSMGIKAALSRTGALVGGGAAIGAGIGAMTGTPIGIAIGAAIGAAIGLVLNHYWPKIVDAGKAAWKDLTNFVVSSVKAAGNLMQTILGAPAWHAIESDASRAWTLVKDEGRLAWSIIQLAVQLVKITLGLIVGGVVSLISNAVTAGNKIGLWHALLVAARVVVQLIAGFFGVILSSVDFIVSGVRTLVGYLQSAATWASRIHIPGGGGGLGGGIVGAVGAAAGAVIPGAGLFFHTAGGIITKPLVAAGGHVFGEAGPEAVIPLSRMSQYAGGGGATIIIQNPVFLTGDRSSARMLARELKPHLDRIVTVGH